MGRRGAMLLALLSCAALLGGCVVIPLGPPITGGSTSAGSSASVKVKAVDNATGPAVSGQTLSASLLKVTAAGAPLKKTAPTGQKAHAGKAFLLVDVDFRNRSSEAVVIKPQDFSLKTDSGATVKPFGTSAGYNARDMRTLNPFLGAWTEFIYEVPNGSASYVFSYVPAVIGKRTTLRWVVP